MIDVNYPTAGQCHAAVWVRDCHRYTGRGKYGFEMHYNKQQCGRKVKDGDKYCWQHRKAVEVK